VKQLQKDRKINLLKSELSKTQQKLEQMLAFAASMRANGEVVSQILTFNENMRRRCQHELHSSKSEIDSF